MSEFSITLPSRGLLNGDKIPGGKVVLRNMSSVEQGILYNPSGDPTLKFDQIISNCLVTKSDKPENLLMTDRVYIMLVLRVSSFGSIYKVPMRCSACRAQYAHELDLAKDMRIKVYEAKDSEQEPNPSYLYIDPEKVKEPFVTEPLARSNNVIEYRLLRGYDEKRIASESKRMLMQSVDPSDPSFNLRLYLMIQKVNGKELTPDEKHMFVKGMDAGDTEDFNRHVEDTESGMDLSFNTVCRSCGFEEEVGLPFTAEFFRPRSTGPRGSFTLAG